MVVLKFMIDLILDGLFILNISDDESAVVKSNLQLAINSDRKNSLNNDYCENDDQCFLGLFFHKIILDYSES